ncbi:MAG: hypothetical protein ACRCUJ_02920 [Phocaeicola sp.]
MNIQKDLIQAINEACILTGGAFYLRIMKPEKGHDLPFHFLEHEFYVQIKPDEEQLGNVNGYSDFDEDCIFREAAHTDDTFLARDIESRLSTFYGVSFDQLASDNNLTGFVNHVNVFGEGPEEGWPVGHRLMSMVELIPLWLEKRAKEDAEEPDFNREIPF